MPNQKRSGKQHSSARLSPREQGLRALQAGRFDEAIAAWQPLARDPAGARALAEAYFRRALSAQAADPLGDLRRAAGLAPADLRVQIQLGRLLHRAGDRGAAEGHYRTVLAREPRNTTAAKLLALLTLEQQPDADLAALPGMTPALQAWAAPAVAMLRGQSPPADESALGALWRGLGELAAGRQEALATLGDERSLPKPALHPLRRYYRGLAAALAGDGAAALKLWQQVYEAGDRPAGLEANLAALLHERLAALLEADDVAGAGKLAEQWALLAGSPAFDELRLQALDRAAHAAAAAGEWARAAQLWEAARQILSGAQGLGSPRPILHNLALAYEHDEDWEAAADAWRGLLRTRTRKRGAEGADDQEEQRWAWVRTRIIDCYKHAGRPDEAVAVFRQAIKADPNDLDLRIQLADALYANEQERAAFNELKRVLAIDPHHPEAVLRHADYLTGRWQFREAEQMVRELAERHPDRPDLRRRVAAVFLHHGREHSRYANYEAAYQAFVEGERYEPANARFPINQARMLGLLKRPVDTGALIERALAVGGETNETWTIAVETWVMAGKLDEARALVARFERERKPDAQDLLALGMQLMAGAIPPPPLSPFMRVAPPAQPVDTPYTAFALEQIEKAVAMKPDDMRILMGVTSFLLLPRPDLARRFAERAVAQAPDDPQPLIMLGVALGLSDDIAEAKATLQRAAQLARKVGRHDLREQAQELRRVIGTPMLRMMLSAEMSGLNDLDDLDDLEDLF